MFIAMVVSVTLCIIVGGYIIYNFEKRSRDPENLPYPHSG
jgi:hypothetical protein